MKGLLVHLTWRMKNDLYCDGGSSDPDDEELLCVSRHERERETVEQRRLCVCLEGGKAYVSSFGNESVTRYGIPCCYMLHYYGLQITCSPGGRIFDSRVRDNNKGKNR